MRKRRSEGVQVVVIQEVLLLFHVELRFGFEGMVPWYYFVSRGISTLKPAFGLAVLFNWPRTRLPDRQQGGWPFSTAAHGWPISDCTGEGLKVSTFLFFVRLFFSFMRKLLLLLVVSLFGVRPHTIRAFEIGHLREV